MSRNKHAFSLRRCRVGVVGLGYVGLPLAVELGKHYETIGFDIKPARVAELRAGRDSTLEVERSDLKAATRLRYTSGLDDLKRCHVFIVTVPTPIDGHNRPDLTPLVRASESVGKVLLPGAVVVYESTVYPGCTEEVCVPILERESDLKYNRDFFVGYSPERINPGDKQHRLTTIRKVTSRSTPPARGRGAGRRHPAACSGALPGQGGYVRADTGSPLRATRRGVHAAAGRGDPLPPAAALSAFLRPGRGAAGS